MDIVKIGIFGVAAAFLALLLGQWKKEYSIFISIAAGLLIFAAVVTKVQVILDFTQKLENLAAVDSGYIRLVIKMVGITYVAVCSECVPGCGLCRDRRTDRELCKALNSRTQPAGAKCFS